MSTTSYTNRIDRTIKLSDGTDTHILRIEPIDGIVRAIPCDIKVHFNAEISDVSIANNIDSTVIDEAYAAAYPDTMYTYDNKGMDRNTFPGKLKEDTWTLQFKYYFTDFTMTEFTITYTIDSTVHTYSFFIHNQARAESGDYILPNDQRSS